jgi:hypothetical protein
LLSSSTTSIPGRLIPLYLSDKFGHFNVFSIAAWLISITILCLWIPFSFGGTAHSHAGPIVFALVYGIVSGCFVSLLLPCAVKTGPIETIGVRFGTFQMVMAVS